MPDVVTDGLVPDVSDGDSGPDADSAAPAFVSLGDGVWVSPAHPAAGERLRIRYEGALATSSSVFVHYGFDGWNEVPGSGATAQDDGTGNLDYFVEMSMTAGTAGLEAEIALPAGVRAVHMVFRDGTGATWDNHAGRDYSLGIPFPYLGPFLTWAQGADPSTDLVVHFHSGFTCRGVVEFGQSGVFDRTVTGSTDAQLHHLTLSGLTADTVYDYRVSCEGGQPSTDYSFRSAPAAGAFTFAVAGDAQDDGESGRWGEVATALHTNHPEAGLLLFVGDAPWNDKAGLWWTFFDRGRELVASRLMATVPGNHDTPTVSSHSDRGTFRWLLGLEPSSQTYRMLRYGTAAFLLLDSEIPGEFAKDVGAQYLFADQVLGSWGASPPSWVFAGFHIPPYNAGARHTGEQGTFRDLTGLFDGRVDWVFSGHEHLGQRMKPLRYNGVLAASGSYGRGSSDGVGYLIVPPAGAWPNTAVIPWDASNAHYRDRLAYPVPGLQENEVSSELGYVIVRVDGTALDLRMFGMGNHAAVVAPHEVDRLTTIRP